MYKILFACLLSASAFGEGRAYVASEAMMSADATGPHRGFAARVIGFKNSQVVPAYIADAQGGCTLSFASNQVAKLTQNEVLNEIRAFSVRNVERKNCIMWESDAGGDDYCVKYAEPFSDLILEGQLARTNGEIASVLCRVFNASDSRLAFAQWMRSISGLLR